MITHIYSRSDKYHSNKAVRVSYVVTDLLRTSSCLDCICFKNSVKHGIFFPIFFLKAETHYILSSNVYFINSIKFYEQMITSYQKFSRLSYGPTFFLLMRHHAFLPVFFRQFPSVGLLFLTCCVYILLKIVLFEIEVCVVLSISRSC